MNKLPVISLPPNYLKKLRMTLGKSCRRIHHHTLQFAKLECVALIHNLEFKHTREGKLRRSWQKAVKILGKCVSRCWLKGETPEWQNWHNLLFAKIWCCRARTKVVGRCYLLENTMLSTLTTIGKHHVCSQWGRVGKQGELRMWVKPCLLAMCDLNRFFFPLLTNVTCFV